MLYASDIKFRESQKNKERMFDPTEQGVKDLVEAAICNSVVNVIHTRSLSDVGLDDGSGDYLQHSIGNLGNARFTQPKTLEEEVKRLQALRSYLVLDSEREFPFERLTALASRILKAPISLVSLVDLGRQWFMSNRGLEEIRETHRKHAFCAHAIAGEDDIFEVRDATQDARFKRNPLVTGHPHIRFYAGAPLVSPEGYKLGTFCIIDTDPRPNGLDMTEKQNLRELSELAVQVLVNRRQKKERECEKNNQLIACTAHDLLTPLSGIELSLALLKDDAQFQNRLTAEQREGIRKAAECSTVLQEICSNVRSSKGGTKNSFELSHIRSQLHSFSIDRLVDRLYVIAEPMEKKVPVKISIDPDVPRTIISDEAKIVRCAMNYLVLACARTRTGMVSLRFSTQTGYEVEKPLLFVHCDDTAPPLELEIYPHLFKPVTSKLCLFPDAYGGKSSVKNRSSNLELALFSVASEMDAVGGEYGFHPRAPEHGLVLDQPADGTSTTGSTFWFSLAYSVPEVKNSPNPMSPEKDFNRSISRELATQFHRSIMGITESPPSSRDESSTNMDVSEKTNMDASENTDAPAKTQQTTEPGAPVTERKRRALIIEDSAVVLKMLTRSLSNLGFEVTQAENGMEGLKELKTSLFDLTICDFLMPVMDGLDCVQQYRQWEKVHRPWIRQRIIGMSAHAAQADVEKALNIGMNDYKNKPVTLPRLKELVATEEQKAMSKRLDDLELTEALSFEVETNGAERMTCNNESDAHAPSENDTESVPQTPAMPSRELTCLVLSPPLSESYAARVQDTIRQAGWHSTSVHGHNEAAAFLKMRSWNMVLADESFSQVVLDFRQWEGQHRIHRQSNVIVISEKLTPGASSSSATIPEGADAIIGKPLGLLALQRLLINKAKELD